MSKEDQPVPDNVTEVKKPVLVEGEIKFMSRAAWKGRTPTFIKNIIKSIQATFIGLIALVSGSTMFTGNQSKVIIFCMSAAAIIAEGIGKGFGVQTLEDKQKEDNK